MKILLTGATGFIGQALVSSLLEQTDVMLQLAIRDNSGKTIGDHMYDHRVTLIPIGNISSRTSWSDALLDCNIVIHAAARVHIFDEQTLDPLSDFREINVEGTLNLARQAMLAGVRRFIYLSSVKVNGEYTQPGRPFSPDTEAMPEDPYAISKYEAEQGLLRLAEKSTMEVVIIRPPLVYGPGVKGNFLRMMQYLEKGIPLPFGALKNNKRSFISIGNLVNLITLCITHPQAANQIFLVSDDSDLSTTDLLRKIRTFLGNRSPLVPVPYWLLNSAAILLKKESELKRLHGSLQVDISKSLKLLNWKPIESVDDALYTTVQDYLHTNEITVNGN